MSQTTDAITPDPILQVASGFMAAKHLFTASAIDLFAAIGEGEATLAELAGRTSVPARTLRVSADAMAALGFVEKSGDRYRNSPVAAAFLAGRTPVDLRPFLKFWDRISYPTWMGLEAAVRGAAPIERSFTSEETKLFNEGVAAVTGGAAHALAGAVDWSRRNRVLDLGGGTGSFLVALIGAHPHLRGTLFDLPRAIAVAREHLKGFGGQIDLLEGDFFEQEIPSGHDAVLLANIVHGFSEEQNRELLRRIRAAVEPGAALLVIDFWLDASRTQPVFPALMSGEFLVMTGAGESYSDEQARAWLAETGWAARDLKPLAGPAGVLVGEAV
ncbi:MAG TPA: methyltransferase [Thermoanaerobaculia bacterium]|jgi:ubiquinone/menaquinone biosynthesis C-methylase UbiE|nr:methyltransferase [Thermoanaerobaculia bacterium]